MSYSERPIASRGGLRPRRLPSPERSPPRDRPAASGGCSFRRRRPVPKKRPCKDSSAAAPAGGGQHPVEPSVRAPSRVGTNERPRNVTSQAESSRFRPAFVPRTREETIRHRGADGTSSPEGAGSVLPLLEPELALRTASRGGRPGSSGSTGTSTTSDMNPAPACNKASGVPVAAASNTVILTGRGRRRFLHLQVCRKSCCKMQGQRVGRVRWRCAISWQLGSHSGNWLARLACSRQNSLIARGAAGSHIVFRFSIVRWYRPRRSARAARESPGFRRSRTTTRRDRRRPAPT